MHFSRKRDAELNRLFSSDFTLSQEAVERKAAQEQKEAEAKAAKVGFFLFITSLSF